MSSKARGTSLPVTLGRRLVAELLHHAKQVPSLPLSRGCRLPMLAAARSQVRPSVSWVAIFARAYGLVSQEIPELRRAWIPFPYARLYEHPSSECAVLLEREWKDELIVVGAKIRGPEHCTVREIDGHLRYYKETPMWDVSPFRQLIRLGMLPGFLRRFFLWKNLNVSGYKRASKLGTFMISSLGNFGVEQHHPLTPLTTYFTFGPIAPDGSVTLKIIYDHRVLDGRHVARALVRLEEILNTTLLAEVRSLTAAAA